MGALGVLAALVIPTLYQNFNNSLIDRAKVIQRRKISQGITMLSVRSTRLAYPTTVAFVQELQKYMQIMKYCTGDQLAECWPSNTVMLSNGEELPIFKAQRGDVFLMGTTDPEGNEASYANDNVAFVTNNGISVLIKFNTWCNPNTNNWNRTCYSALVDANGSKGPNKVGEDLFLLNANGFIQPVEDLDPEAAGAAGSNTRRDHHFDGW